LAFIVPPNPGKNGAPIKYLIGFSRIHLTPGEKKTLDFPITAHDLSLVQIDGIRIAQRGVWKVRIGNSEVDINVI